MKIVEVDFSSELPTDFTGIAIVSNLSPDPPSRQFYLNGELHRDNGPAIEVVIGNHLVEYWIVNGKYHREDGPAIIEPFDSTLEWWLNDVRFETKEEWFQALTPEQKENALWSECLWK